MIAPEGMVGGRKKRTFFGVDGEKEKKRKKGPGNRYPGALIIKYLTATHTIAAIQAFVAGAAADGNVAASIAGRCVALHAPRRCVDGLKPVVCAVRLARFDSLPHAGWFRGPG